MLQQQLIKRLCVFNTFATLAEPVVWNRLGSHLAGNRWEESPNTKGQRAG